MKKIDYYDMDERNQKAKILWAKILYFLVIYFMISSFFSFVVNMIEYKKQEKAEQEMIALVKQKNSEISLLTDVDESFFYTDAKYLEFENGIRIPLPIYLADVAETAYCKKGFESNEIAHQSYVVKVVYGENSNVTDIIIDIFKDRLPKDHNYEPVYYYDDYGTRIYTREEKEGYFSYIIFRGMEVTYGVCYGEPKIKNI